MARITFFCKLKRGSRMEGCVRPQIDEAYDINEWNKEKYNSFKVSGLT